MRRRKASDSQRFALKVYLFAIDSEFDPDVLKQFIIDIDELVYEDEFLDIEAVLIAEAAGSFFEQIKRFFVRLIS